MNNKKIKFAHLADLHLGAWREKKLTDLNFLTFQKSIDFIIEEKLDFVIFAGDIFNSTLPPIDILNKVVKELMKLKRNRIPIYVIGGSHDYSNSGKSFLDILKSARIIVDVNRYKRTDLNEIELIPILNENFKISICGILGRKNGLDKNIYKNLKLSSINKDYFNIFVFHTTLNDFKPKFLEGYKTEVNSSFLPEGFDYYAGGHVHTFIEGEYKGSKLSYPSVLFPNNFTELKREKPSFNICTYDFNSKKLDIKRKFIEICDVEYLSFEFNGENPILAKSIIEEKINSINYYEKILLLELSGIIDGKINDIELNKIISKLKENGVFIVLKNTYKLKSSIIERANINISENGFEIENQIIEEKLNEDNSLNEKKEFINLEIKNLIIRKLIEKDFSKNEDEKKEDFEKRVENSFEEIFKIALNHS